MAKKKKTKPLTIVPLIGVVLAIAAVACLFAPGVNSYTAAFGSDPVYGSSPLSGFDFFLQGFTGGYDIPEGLNNVMNLGPYGGLIAAFALLCVGVALPLVGVLLALIGLKKAGAALEILGGAAVVVGGVMSILALNIAGISEAFDIGIVEAGFTLEYGLWLTGIAGILGGICSVAGGAVNAIK